MSDFKNIQGYVEQAVGEVLNNALPGLREQIAQRVMERLGSGSGSAVALGDSAVLNATQAAVQAGSTQVQILDAMIEGAAHFAVRTALFVVRGANAVGWRARGFADDEALKTSPLELSEGLAARAVHSRVPISGASSEFMPDFAERFGGAQEPATVYPLVVRDKVVAVIYADGGTNEHRFDRPAMEALVRSTGLWLEVFATRKAGGPLSTTEAIHQPAATAMAAAAAAAPAPAPVATPAPAPTPVQTAPEPEHAHVAAPPKPPAAVEKKEDEVQKKARRFAKLLVDEIKLYNQNKVTEGRQNRDLYDRLKEDIEKSRASYEKRYGNTSAKDGDYFNQELLRILADNDRSLFGGNFPH